MTPVIFRHFFNTHIKNLPVLTVIDMRLYLSLLLANERKLKRR